MNTTHIEDVITRAELVAFLRDQVRALAMPVSACAELLEEWDERHPWTWEDVADMCDAYPYAVESALLNHGDHS